MGCNASAAIERPMLEIVGNPLDIEISQVSVTTTVRSHQEMFANTTHVKMSTNDDELLQEIVNHAQNFKPLLFCGPSLEVPSTSLKENMAVAFCAKPLEIKLNYDCVYGPSNYSSQLETMMIVHQLSSGLHTKVGTFFQKPIIDMKSCGLDQLMSIIMEHIHQGWRPVVILSTSCDASTTGSGTTGRGIHSTNSTTSSTVLKIIFQKNSNLIYSDIQIIPFQMINNFTSHGMVTEPFDMSIVLNEHGKEGWELASIFPLLNANEEQNNKVQVTSMGMRGTTTTTYLAIMIRPTTTSIRPIKYTKITESTSYMVQNNKEKKDSIIMSAVRTAAQAGWTLNSIIQLPGQMKNNKFIIPIQLYLSAYTTTDSTTPEAYKVN